MRWLSLPDKSDVRFWSLNWKCQTEANGMYKHIGTGIKSKSPRTSSSSTLPSYEMLSNKRTQIWEGTRNNRYCNWHFVWRIWQPGAPKRFLNWIVANRTTTRIYRIQTACIDHSNFRDASINNSRIPAEWSENQRSTVRRLAVVPWS